ncbi:MAG: hypothetical protein EXS36_05730 [Pedosphaera sp.]|nr:hypothetical protein [Pedosphaera sp.]
MTTPSPLGLHRSFGFGDRLGLATPGHLAALRHVPGFAPIFAQQSIREMARTQRTPEEVMQAAQNALSSAGFTGTWGADGDHLKTPADVQRVAAAGFCFFTIDPSAFVNNAADTMTEIEVQDEVERICADSTFAGVEFRDVYLGHEFPATEGAPLKFTSGDLDRAVVKYGRAVAHCEHMGKAIASACGSRAFEIEVSVDETDSPTRLLEHLFFGLELRRRGVPNVVSLAPRFIGDFEKGIDYRGDHAAFESQLRRHVAIARYCGPYKISIHSGSDKFSIYPAIGRVCGDLLHVKTAGTSYLEALRVVARCEPSLFREIAHYCRGRFAIDRASYHISSTDAAVAALPPFTGSTEEVPYLDEVVGRQLLHVTFGSVLTAGIDSLGRRFKEGILECLQRNDSLHQQLLESHFTHHLSLLNAG